MDRLAMSNATLVTPATAPRAPTLGLILVALSAITWSFGGTIARFLETTDSWQIVFWRSFWATVFLLGFMLARDGVAGTVLLYRSMGSPGLMVALCFATASTAFVIALQYTTVANILLMQAGVPLMAALMGVVLFRETPSLATWIAIGAVIFGVAVMVSESFTGEVSPIGDGLALLIAVVFAAATVITRRHAHVRMTPAVALGTGLAGLVALSMGGAIVASAADMGLLFAFGALNLGLGLAFFVTGARLIPAAVAALIGTLEPVLGPLWVYWIHAETPSTRTVLGGAIILTALLAHILWQARARPA
jgi:drug/metabolite transporter (DMT)-like permease